jgi:putative spermidine/putrescine transport system substrate-binding protein
MFRPTLSRRQLLSGLSALAASGTLPAWAQAQAQSRIVAMTFPGTWEKAARSVLLPAFKKVSPAEVTISPVIIVDALAKLAASKATPPYDVIMLDEPAEILARAQGLLEPLPVGKIPNLAKLPKSLVGKDGFGAMAAMQVFGIAYNPKTVKVAPKSWEELWRPEYKGRVLINGPDTTIGATWMVNLAKMHGGSETNLEPAWKAMEKLKPNLATIPANPGAVGPLFQQGQADIAVGFLSVVEPLRLRGVDVAIAKPETGWGIVSNLVHLVKGSKSPDEAAAYINTMLDTQVQAQLAQEPYFSVPSNREVPFTGALASVASNVDELVKSRDINWAPIAEQRRDLIDRFNREFRRR